MLRNFNNAPWMKNYKDGWNEEQRFISSMAYKALKMNSMLNKNYSLERALEILFGIVFIVMFFFFLGISSDNSSWVTLAGIVSLVSGMLLLIPNWGVYAKSTMHIFVTARSNRELDGKNMKVFLARAMASRQQKGHRKTCSILPVSSWNIPIRILDNNINSLSSDDSKGCYLKPDIDHVYGRNW